VNISVAYYSYVTKQHDTMEIQRKKYLDKLIAHKGNQRVKIVIVNDDLLLRRNEAGVVTMSLREFFMNDQSLDL